MSEKDNDQIKKILSGKRILLPLALSIIVFFILFSTVPFSVFLKIKYNFLFCMAMAGAVLMAMIRDFMYVLRLRILTNAEIGWRKCLQIVLLWELASAITPSAVGGSLAAVYMLEKEKIPLGKSSSIVLIAAFLDELVFILVMPVLFLFLGNQLFHFDVTCPDARELYLASWYKEVKLIVFGIYFFLLGVYIVMYYGLFINSTGLKKAYQYLSRLKPLKRWEAQLFKAGVDIELASKEFSNKSFWFWFQSFLTTFITWSARYSVAFFVVWGISAMIPDFIELYGRQYFIRTLTILPLSPGGEGIAEIAFVAFLCEYMPGSLTKVAVIIWRFLTYHIYLLLGIIVFPIWLREDNAANGATRLKNQ